MVKWTPGMISAGLGALSFPAILFPLGSLAFGAIAFITGVLALARGPRNERILGALGLVLGLIAIYLALWSQSLRY